MNFMNKALIQERTTTNNRLDHTELLIMDLMRNCEDPTSMIAARDEIIREAKKIHDLINN